MVWAWKAERTMNGPTVIRLLFRLIQDTFRQARASGLLWMVLGVNGLCIFFCLSVSISGGTTIFQPGETRQFLPPGDQEAQDSTKMARHGVEAPKGEFTMLFGLIRVRFIHYREELVHFLQLLLAAGVGGMVGILFLLIWTADFLPEFLKPGAILVLLAKPSPRGLLLVGKYVGVVVFVLSQCLLLVGGTWLALGVKTGVWDPSYLVCIPLLGIQFAVFFGFSLLLAVVWRDFYACVFGSIVFWFTCWGINFGRYLLVLRWADDMAGPMAWAWEFLYWLLPKPVDLVTIQFAAQQTEGYFTSVLDVKALHASGAFQPELSVVSSLLFAAGTLVLSILWFRRTDY
jgi:ABC-type transport system involved in multi-copper enzyme maturation permease subunit